VKKRAPVTGLTIPVQDSHEFSPARLKRYRLSEAEIVHTLLWTKQKNDELHSEAALLKDIGTDHQAYVEVKKKIAPVASAAAATKKRLGAQDTNKATGKKFKPPLKDDGPGKVVFHRPDFDDWDSLEVS